MNQWLSKMACAAKCASTLFVAWTALGSGVLHAEIPDVLDRPSLQTTRASGRTMLAVTRAGTRLVAVGERGIAVWSDDNGVSWRQAAVPVSVTLTNLHFPTRDKGWAVGHGGVVLHSEDGGQTWFKQLDGVRAALLMRDFARQDRDLPGGAANLAEAEALVADGPDKPFLDVYFQSETDGMVVGAYGLAFVTKDGGRNWQPWTQQIPNPQGRHLNRICATDGELWIAGEQGALFRSTDGGRTFNEIRSPYGGSLFGLMATGGNLVAFGLRGNAFHSADHGETWQKIDTASPSTLAGGMRLADDTLTMIDEAGRILHSSDGGRSFRPISTHGGPLIGVSQAADGGFVLVGVQGITRIPSLKFAEAKQ